MAQLAQWPWANPFCQDSVSPYVQWEQPYLCQPTFKDCEDNEYFMDLSPLDCREPEPATAMASRIGLRMQLMREQAQQEEQRERMQQQAVMHYMQQQQQQQPQPQLGGPPTPAINTPVHFQSPPPVPGEVLKVGPLPRLPLLPQESQPLPQLCLPPPQVQSYLENPTSYHLQQSQHQKVREYLSETYGNKFAAHISPAQGSPKPPPAASPGVRAGHVLSTSASNSAPNSPMAMLHISSNPEKEVSEGRPFGGPWGSLDKSGFDGQGGAVSSGSSCLRETQSCPREPSSELSYHLLTGSAGDKADSEKSRALS